MLLVIIVAGIILGLISALVANIKGRNVIGWFLLGFALGFFLNIIGGIIMAIILACLSNLKEEECRRQHADRERRLLREQLYQERLKNQAFQQYANARLDQHDQVLQIDTTSHESLPNLQPVSGPALAGGGGEIGKTQPNDALGELSQSINPTPPAFPPSITPPPFQSEILSSGNDGQWFVYMDNKKFGPGATEQIIGLIQKGKVNANTQVWTHGMPQPVPAGECPAFKPYLY